MGSPQAEHNLRRWHKSFLVEKTATRREKDGLGGGERMSVTKREIVTHETKVALLEEKEGAGRLSARFEGICEDPDAPLSCLADLPECSDEA